ncbi:MAG: hypothetical protein LBB81_00290 [Treponema sp.]|jgi:thymidine kinase|nr:hypothetical protein [Treponema sp.]
MQDKVILVMGPMFSGKSSFLLNEIDKATIAKIPCCLVRPDIDTRDYYTHKGLKTDTVIYKVNDLKQVPFTDYKVICVDEGQFFDSLTYAFEWALNGIKVFISALNGDRYQKEWKAIQELIPLVDDIVFFKAVCSKCGSYDAAFSYKVDDTSQSQIDIGGSAESFIALCRDCLNEIKEREKGQIKLSLSA